MRVALVTCVELPEADPDEELLVRALREAGVDAEMLAWDDPAADPRAFDLCVLRSTWNYYRAPDAFRAWIDRAGAGARLLNPPDLLLWNLHKRYLDEVAVPVVPTAFVPRGADARLDDLLAERGWDDVVIKPAVSAGSFRTRRFPPGARAEARAFLAALAADRDAMVQPFLPGAERALVFVDGAFTHGVEKSPRFAGGAERVSEGLPLTAEERAFAERALGPHARRLLYARVDVLRDATGALRLSELELIEPSLFLLQGPAALARLVAAIRRAVAG